jgi:hypothetical protein
MKKLIAATLALGLLSGCTMSLWEYRDMVRREKERDKLAQSAAPTPATNTAVDNIKSAAENNPVTTGLIVLGVLGALNNSDNNVTATTTATATATSTSTSTSTATK